MGLLSLREIGLEFGSEIDWWSVIGVIVSPKESNLAELTWYFSSGPNRGPSGHPDTLPLMRRSKCCQGVLGWSSCQGPGFNWNPNQSMDQYMDRLPRVASCTDGLGAHSTFASLMWLWDIWDDSGSDLGWRLSKLDKKKSVDRNLKRHEKRLRSYLWNQFPSDDSMWQRVTIPEISWGNWPNMVPKIPHEKCRNFRISKRRPLWLLRSSRKNNYEDRGNSREVYGGMHVKGEREREMDIYI